MWNELLMLRAVQALSMSLIFMNHFPVSLKKVFYLNYAKHLRPLDHFTSVTSDFVHLAAPGLSM